MSASNPRPLFVYGTLRAMPLLAWALTGDATNIPAVSKLVQPAKVFGYARFSLHHRDYPAAVRHKPDSAVDGYLLIPKTTSQRKMLDDFEGEAYEPVPVAVTVFDSDGNPRENTVDADMYIWASDEDAVTSKPWDLDVFERESLGDWLDLFEGVELAGEGEE